MALQVPERTVVAEDVEAVAGALEGPARFVPPVGTIADVGTQDLQSFLGVHAACYLQQLRIRELRGGVERRSHHLHLALRVELGEGHLGLVAGRDPAQSLGAQTFHRLARLGQVAAPASSSLENVDSSQKSRDHLAQLGQHHLRVVSDFGQRVGPHAQEQRLVRLPGPVDPHVGQRCRGQHPAQRIQRLGPNGAVVDALRHTLLAGMALPKEDLHLLQPFGVDREGAVQSLDVPRTQRSVGKLRGHVVLEAPTGPAGVRHVARRLLEVGHQPAPLQDLGQDVGRALAGEVHTAQLGHRVVAVFQEHPFVELLSALHADGGGHCLRLHLLHELIEE